MEILNADMHFKAGLPQIMYTKIVDRVVTTFVYKIQRTSAKSDWFNLF